jgi:hypothetical protein
MKRSPDTEGTGAITKIEGTETRRSAVRMTNLK